MEAIELVIGKTKVMATRGDITKTKVDAIVNAANKSLLGGGGVDRAIHLAGGSAILDECRHVVGTVGGVWPTGGVAVTGAGALDARFVFHAVGPVYIDGNHGEPTQLACCYQKSLELADERGCTSIAFPCVSTGIFGYPKPLACKIAVATVIEYVQNGTTGITHVMFVTFDIESFDFYKKELGGRQE